MENVFSKDYKFISPTKVLLPTTLADYRRKGGDTFQKFITQDYVYVPLLPQLERLLNIREIFEEVSNTKEFKNFCWQNYEDGNYFKNSPLFQRFPQALQIHLYLDEVQMCSPVGSYSHKMFLVYFSLGNIDAKKRSKLKCINLLSIFYTDHVASFDLNEILKPIVNDLLKLENGVILNIGGSYKLIHGTLTVVCADNLASHQIGGFKCGFAKGFRKCRFCLGVEKDIQKKFSHCEFVARTKEQHVSACSTMDEVSELRQHYSKLYGINGNSILNSLQYFHVVHGLPPDLMHDLFEGIVPIFVTKVINHLVSRKLVCIDKLNFDIENFNYDANDRRDKPSKITMDHLKKSTKLRQSSAQMWLLFVHLPLFTCTSVSAKLKDNTWKCYHMLGDIVRLLFKDVMFETDILKLGWLISDFLTSYKKTFKSKITFKMHQMIHYPEVIKNFGPLHSLWCIRYEGKHAFFKRKAKQIGNFINLPWTLAYRHELWICQQIQSCRENFLGSDFKFSKPKIVFLQHNKPYFGRVSEVLQLTAEQQSVATFESFSSITIGSTIYKVNKSVVICPIEFARTKAGLGLLEMIIKNDDRILFICKMLRIKSFSERFQAYEVSFVNEQNFYCVVEPHNIVRQVSFKLLKPTCERVSPSKFYILSKTFVNDLLIPVLS